MIIVYNDVSNSLVCTVVSTPQKRKIIHELGMRMSRQNNTMEYNGHGEWEEIRMYGAFCVQ